MENGFSLEHAEEMTATLQLLFPIFTIMNIESIIINNTIIAEVSSDDKVISSIDDGTELVGNLYYNGFDKVILYEKNIIPAFFDLKTKMAGEILQKFSNYRIRLAIVGDFDHIKSQSLREFISESNKGRQINFTKNREEAIHVLNSK